MRAGTLRTPMTLLQRTQTGTDPDGQPIFAWSTTGPTIWVARDQFTGREFFEARAQLGETAERFRTRHRSDITRLSRLQDASGNLYHIEAVQNVEDRNHELVLTVTSMGAGN